jgi:hypothetical protein
MRLLLRMLVGVLALAAGTGCPPARGPQTGPPRAAPAVGLLTWPRMRAVEFGCLLQTRYRARDPRWSCATPDTGPRGDPCGDTVAYYAGPAFPPERAGEVAPGVVDVRLSWEHRNLQSVVVELEGELTEAEARRRLDLPAAGAALPANVQAITVQRCGRGRTCVDLVGFDHLGAGEVDCPR